MDLLNKQPTRELHQFQKVIVQGMYIQQLNKWLDELEWENEKKDALIEMKEKEISDLEQRLSKQITQRQKIEKQFKEYAAKIKESKINIGKHTKQQAIIDELRHELDSVKKRLQVSHRMNELLTKQKV